MSPFDDVISVVVPQRTILSLKRKTSQQFLCFPFLNFVCLTLFLLFFVNDLRDLPLMFRRFSAALEQVFKDLSRLS